MQEWERNIDGHIGPEALFWRRPIGWWWILLAGVNATVLFVAMTPPGHYIWPGVVAAAAWFGLLIFWIFRFTAYLATNAALGRPHAFTYGRWLRQLAIPMIFVFSLATLLMDAPLHLAFAASRPSLDRIAAGDEPGGWVGAYPVGKVDRRAEATWITVRHAGWVENGFVHVPDGRRPTAERTGELRELGGGWYAFARQ